MGQQTSMYIPFIHLPLRCFLIFLVQNEHGKKAPTLATFVAERNCKPQGFSQSFGSVKFKNSSLNTGISKSNVHPTLDPIFS